MENELNEALGESEDFVENEADMKEHDESSSNLGARKLQLEEEIAALEAELEKKIEETDRRVREYGEFRELFPDADAAELPEDVDDMLASGVPLCAAYALYEKRVLSKNNAAARHNNATKISGFGSVGRGVDDEFYSPDEVRAMTRAEVRQNYQKIINSMKNWH